MFNDKPHARRMRRDKSQAEFNDHEQPRPAQPGDTGVGETYGCGVCGKEFPVFSEYMQHVCKSSESESDDYDIEQGRIEFQKELADAMLRAGAKEVELPAPRAAEREATWTLGHVPTNARGTKTLFHGNTPVAIVGTESLNDHQRALNMTLALNQHSTLVAQRDRLLEALRSFVSPTQCYCHTLLYDRGSRKCGQCEARELIATIQQSVKHAGEGGGGR